MTARILVAGIGNIFFGDDGFGSAVIQRLLADEHRRGAEHANEDDVTAPEPAATHIEDYGIRGMHLAFDMITGYERVIVVDAMSRAGVPGTLYVIEPNVDTPGPPADAHGMDLQNVFAFVRALGSDIPPVEVVGCEPQTLDEGIGLSAPVEAALESAVAVVRKRIAIVLAYPSRPARAEGESACSEV